jgi:hypothetical protein
MKTLNREFYIPTDAVKLENKELKLEFYLSESQ